MNFPCPDCQLLGGRGCLIEKGMMNVMGSNMALGGDGSGGEEATPTQKIPYNTNELRSIVLGKYLGPSGTTNPGDDPINLCVRDEVREAFANFVLHVPIFIDGLRIGRKAWAKAFCETNIANSAKCLFEALFSKEEMKNCSRTGKNNTQELSSVKMLAILRASCWMKNKAQDPYFFNSEIPSHNVHPTKWEQDEIMTKVFTQHRNQANQKKRRRQDGSGGSNGLIEGGSDSQNMDLDRNSNASDDIASSPGVDSISSLSPHPIPPLIARDVPTEEFGELEELFYRYPEEFLDTLLPRWEESYVFIDGLLVEQEKWRKAFAEADPVKASRILFRALFPGHEIQSCIEPCPVKKLAIIRAIEWMRQNQGRPELSTYWDNDDDDCNVFPSIEDKKKVETSLASIFYSKKESLELAKPTS